jgi:hypothetical protein
MPRPAFNTCFCLIGAQLSCENIFSDLQPGSRPTQVSVFLHRTIYFGQYLHNPARSGNFSVHSGQIPPSDNGAQSKFCQPRGFSKQLLKSLPSICANKRIGVFSTGHLHYPHT